MAKINGPAFPARFGNPQGMGAQSKAAHPPGGEIAGMQGGYPKMPG